MMCAIGDHLLKMHSLLYIFPSGSGSVNIDGNNPEALSLAVRNAVSKLSLNRLFLLPF